MREFTVEDLRRGDGCEGRPALVAVDGKVYDVSWSRMWREGAHARLHRAGEDLSLALRAAPHEAEVLDGFKQIGVLVGEEQGAAPEAQETPALAKLLLKHHAHPVTVHFPIALSALGSFTIALFLVTRHAPLEAFALYCIAIAAVTSPATIAAGLLSWVYNFSGVWTPLFRAKIFLSGVLVALQVGALAIRLLAVNSPDPTAIAYCVYVVLVLAMAPTVSVLGYVGGKITFPE